LDVGAAELSERKTTCAMGKSTGGDSSDEDHFKESKKWSGTPDDMAALSVTAAQIHLEYNNFIIPQPERPRVF